MTKSTWNEIKFLIHNVHSLAYKERDLFEYVEAHDVDIAVLTETWEKKDHERWDHLREFIQKDKDWGISSSPRTRKDKAHGGGTMILWNQKRLTKINIELPKQKDKLEWTATAFKFPNGHKLVVVATYIAPDITRKSPDRALNGLVERLMRQVPGASIMIGGDFNACDHRLEMNHPQLAEHQSPPTWPADNPSRRLDLLITDFPHAVSGIKTSKGLKHNESATRSDHLILTGQIDLKKIHPKPRPKEVFEFRAGGDEGKNATIKAINEADWSGVEDAVGAEAKAMAFMAVVLAILNRHKPWRKGIRREQDPLWMTSGLRKMLQNKSTEYRRNGYSERFKRLKRAADKAIKARRKHHFKEYIQKMLRSDPATFYRKFKQLFELGEYAGWTPYDAVPDEEDKTKARERMADYFSKISQEYRPLEHSRLPHNDERPVRVEAGELADLLHSVHVPGGSVEGDVDGVTLKACAGSLSRPLAEIFNTMFEEGYWPSCWKNETCVILPKKAGAADLGKTRPISMTSMWSKIGERILWSYIDKGIGHLQSKFQFGARKGMGAAHMMTLVLHNLLTIDDDPCTTPVMLGFDLQKAFNRGDHGDMINVLKAKGLKNWAVNTMASFLSGRKLRVKVGCEWSTERQMPGGIGQGTIGGPALFTLLTESLDDILARKSIPSAYIDDRSAIIALRNDEARVEDDGGLVRVHHEGRGAQEVIDEFQAGIDELGMRLNGTKTEVVIFDKRDKSINHIDLNTRDGPIREMDYTDTFKLVGWTFKRSINAAAHIKTLITTANKKKFIIRKLKSSGVGKQFLVRAYTTFVRPCVEYLSVVYDAMVTKEEQGLIETCQRDFLRAIYGYNNSYKELLRKSGLERLDERRRKAVLKFCAKVRMDPRFDWFEQDSDERLRPRTGAKAPKVNKASTKRSPLHHFRRVVLGEKYGVEAAAGPEEAEDDMSGLVEDMEREFALQMTDRLQAWFHPED